MVTNADRLLSANEMSFNESQTEVGSGKNRTPKWVAAVSLECQVIWKPCPEMAQTGH